MTLDLNMIGQTMLSEKQQSNDLGAGKYFLNQTYKALTLKENMENWTILK